MTWYDQKAIEIMTKTLEHQTITKIKPTKNVEAGIIEIYLANGQAYRICGNDLGIWYDQIAGTNGYQTLTDLMRDLSEDWFEATRSNPNINPIFATNNQILEAQLDGKHYMIKMVNLDAAEIQIITHPQGLQLLSEYVIYGGNWKVCFAINDPHRQHYGRDKTPEELRLFEDQQ